MNSDGKQERITESSLWDGTHEDNSTVPSSSSLLLQRQLLDRFERLDQSDLQREQERIIEARAELKQEWEIESAKYEESLPSSSPMSLCCSSSVISNDINRFPRRNYFNPAGIVQDKSLFPYVDQFYSLIDCYDCLYDVRQDEADDSVGSEGLQPQQPMQKQSPRPRSEPVQARRRFRQWQNVMPEDHFLIEQDEVDHLLTSSQAIHQSFFSSAEEIVLRQTFNWYSVMENGNPGARGFPSLQGGLVNTFPRLFSMFENGKTREEVDAVDQSHDKKMNLPEANAILRVIRHAMSELQRDCYLASCAVVRLAQQGALDNTDILRRLLLIFDAEFVVCGYPCVDNGNDDHICFEWNELVETLIAAVAQSISFISQDHTLVLAGFVKATYWRAFGHLIEMNGNICIQTKQRQMLKRTVVGRNDQTLPVKLVVAIIQSLGKRAHLERIRCQAAMARDDVSELNLHKCLDSYWNCVRALVEVGESTIETLPDSERFYEIASEIVRSLAFCMISGLERPRSGDGAMRYIRSPLLRSLIDPLRYADTIMESTEIVRRERELIRAAEASEGVRGAIARVLKQVDRPTDVKDVVRGLFVSDMVEIENSGLGYGDFLVWAGYGVDAHDPVLFWNMYNFPMTEDEDESDADDELSDVGDSWEKRESGSFWNRTALNHLYTYTLLLLVRAWNAPWSPESHMSFQHGFREAVKTVALCTNRLRMPNEIALKVGSYLNRRWWPDDRCQCWSYECNVESLERQLQRKRGGTVRSTNKSMRCQPCSGCGVAWYCSKKCREDDFRVGHKKVCGLPPMNVRCNAKEYDLHLAVFDALSIPAYLANDKMEMDRLEHLDRSSEEKYNESENDGQWSNDGSWESMESGHEQVSDNGFIADRTEAIFRFFNSMKA